MNIGCNVTSKASTCYVKATKLLTQILPKCCQTDTKWKSFYKVFSVFYSSCITRRIETVRRKAAEI